MKKASRWLWGLARFALGAGIVVLLLRRIDSGSVRVTFAVPATSVCEGAVYADASDPARRYLVLEALVQGRELRALAQPPAGAQAPASGALQRVAGGGPDRLAWSACRSAPCGLRLLGHAFRGAAHAWPLLVLAVGTYLVCLCLVAVRWRCILVAQGLPLAWGKTLKYLFIGQFFNAFMFGATGGDVVKAYYVSRETHGRKTEAAATVFVDRATGMVALAILAAGFMLLRWDLFIASVEGRYALVFVGAMAAACLLGFALLWSVDRLTRAGGAPARLARSRPGQMALRVHAAFYGCFTHPALLAKTLAASVLNQLAILFMMYCLGTALAMERPFLDYLAIGPTVNSIGAVPITPGGLGLREYAAVTYFALVGVPATKAFALSLSVYATMLLWSLVGGLVFLFSGGSSAEVLKESAAEER